MGKSACIRRAYALVPLVILLLPMMVHAQEIARAVRRFDLESAVQLHGAVRPWAYLGDQGRRAAILGTEAGSFEVWAWPGILARDLRLAFRISESEEPIEAAAVARNVVVRAEGFTISYSHPAFTVKQHVFVPLNEPGIVMLLDVRNVRPLDVIVRMDAESNFVRPDSIIRIDTSTAERDYIPIIIASDTVAQDSADSVYSRLLDRAAVYWHQKVTHYRGVRDNLLRVGTPDRTLNQAIDWAKVNLDQQLVCEPDLGCGFVTGFNAVGKNRFRSATGWYSGTDAAISSLAMNGLGQFDHARQALAFLSRHDDTGPFWLLACYEYWLASGDMKFLREFWPNISRAFTSIAATDTDRDGLIDIPKTGMGAIAVNGLGEIQRTNIYLAGAWTAALPGISEMSRRLSDQATAQRADSIYVRAQASLEKFWNDRAGLYSFALLEPAPGDTTGRLRRSDALTIFPAAALSFGLLEDARARRMLREIGSSAITSDWGVRKLSRYDRLYDPLSYNNGAVWPFATGFAALAHYRYHRGWAGYDLVRDVARATMDFARGRTPEVLSGAFYDVLDTAVPQHSSASSMLVTPLVRGLIGFSTDASNRAMSIEPHLPVDWDSLEISGLRAGNDQFDAVIQRAPGQYSIQLRRTRGTGTVFVRFAPALPLGARVHTVFVDDRDVPVQVEESVHDVHAIVELPLVEEATITIEYDDGLEVVTPQENMRQGDASEALKVLDFRRDRSSPDYLIEVEGVPGASYRLELRKSVTLRSAVGAEIVSQTESSATLNMRIPPGSAPFVRHTIRVRT